MFQALPADEIVITASRTPQEKDESAAGVTIIDADRIERLGEPLLTSLLRLAPSTAVSVGGPAGSFTQVRIRGSEANHTLLLIDGMRINDPARGNQPPFELLNADIASRVEVVRGPQSALWGSEAIGGVVAVNGVDDVAGAGGGVEAGSFGFRRAHASAATSLGRANLAAAVGWQRADGIDSFDGTGDRDGYRNLSARLRGTWRIADAIEAGVAGVALSGRSQFDGYDENFAHVDTLDSNRNRLSAGRLWLAYGKAETAWRGHIATSLLGSTNRNLLAGDEINRTKGGRWTLSAQLEHRFETGSLDHRLIGAVEHEEEEFEASGDGGVDQERSRAHQSVTVEWQGDAGPLHADLAVRRDSFNRFADATSLRASLLAELGRGFALATSYGEGIAQPTFFDLYGFFPDSFVGNPDLKPESTRGFEASVRYRGKSLDASLSAYRQRLRDEILDTFDTEAFLSSTANSSETSRRWGIEAELGWAIKDIGRLSATYSYLRATQPDVAGDAQVRELRRPKHSGSVALDGRRNRFAYGFSLAHTGTQYDQRDVFPYDLVRLSPYWLAGARLAYQLPLGLEMFARAANALDADYQDAFGYRTEGRSLHAGIRIAARP